MAIPNFHKSFLQGQTLLGLFLWLYQKCPRETVSPLGLAKIRSCRMAQKLRALHFIRNKG